MLITIELNDKERKLAEKYAEKHSLSLEEAFKHALYEQFEDEYVAALANEAYKEFIESGEVTRPIEELWKETEE